MPKFLRAILPLLAATSAFAPLSARADVGGDVMSFFGHVAKVVKTHVVALPDRLGISDLIDSQFHATADSHTAADHPAAGDPPSVSLAPDDISIKAELAHFATPALPNIQIALPEPSVETGTHRLFCAEYARLRTGFPVFGDAKYWWEKARNLYDRVAQPVSDSVMVFAASKRLQRGHVAVVTDIVSPREIRVDQANWQNHGEIDHSTPVLDVSTDNDWSKVRVWDVRSRQFGAHVYAISGFIVKPLVRQAAVN